jgi:peptidyl-prolyl cis-trans isomerase SurA
MTYLRNLILAAALALPLPALAANPFAAAVTVDGKAVTHYEIDQRIKLMEVLRLPGDLRKEAEEALVNERLQQIAAEQAGVTVTPEQLQAGMEEFAARGNLTAEQLLPILEQNGISKESFQAFIQASLAWRFVIQARFSGRAQVSDAEVDRAMALTKGGAQVLLAEIILPARTPEEAEQSQALAEELHTTLKGEAAFSRAARQYSAAPSGQAGGRRGWTPIANLPPQLGNILLTLQPGAASAPIPLQNAIAVFQVRGLQETAVKAPKTLAVDYATLALPAGDPKYDPAIVAGQVDTCDDLYGVAMTLPEGALTRQALPLTKIPRDIAVELATLDANETSQGLSRAGSGVNMLLMLCARTTELAEEGREEARRALINARLEAYAQSYLEELRAAAVITQK